MKAYSQARAKLEPMLKDCANLIQWYDMGWIRNDLTITRFKHDNADHRRVTKKHLSEILNSKEDDKQWEMITDCHQLPQSRDALPKSGYPLETT
jgi:hypothetical protein